MTQRAMGLSAAATAFVLLPWPAVSVATSLLAGRLPERLSGAARLVVVAAGMTLVVRLQPTTPPPRLVVAMGIAGIGTGLVNATFGRESVASVPPHQAGVGSGINNTSRYLGAAIGVTVVSVITSPVGGESPTVLLDNWSRAALVGIALTVVCLLVVGLFESLRRRTPTSPLLSGRPPGPRSERAGAAAWQ